MRMRLYVVDDAGVRPVLLCKYCKSDKNTRDTVDKLEDGRMWGAQSAMIKYVYERHAGTSGARPRAR